jgi:decaprenylphospho-beta-D-ribofuranose 2-oxidase
MRREIHGWGRTPRVVSDVRPLPVDQLAACVTAANGRGLLARGLGRAYGDAAQNAGGHVLDATTIPERIEGGADGLVTVSAGTGLEALLRWSVPRGWMVPVIPGTRFVTIGGAIAADIHGKNHHKHGSFSQHVRSIEIYTPADGVITVRPGHPLFEATAGGMGLTGIILSAQVQLTPIQSAAMAVDTERQGDLDRVLQRLRELDATRTYSVAWLDLLARGSSLGRGVITAAEHAPRDALRGRWADDPLSFSPRALARVPDLAPSRLLGPLSVGAFNELWYRKAPRSRQGELQSITSFFHPLDGLQDWNRLYGRRGFFQYQFVVPEESTDVLRSIVERVSASRVASFLCVLKWFGPEASGHLSFPKAGWTITIDIPSDPRIAAALDVFDEEVTEAGGRVYLAKDARMRARFVPDMYPRLEEWRAVRDRHDPDGCLTSDLDRRLDLSGRHG